LILSPPPAAIRTPDAHTAVLFFSHRPEREWQNKQLVRQDYAKSRRVADALYRHARHAVAQSGLPVLDVTGAEQRGQRFGTRLANALADAFAQGYEQVIVVGSDCPRLHEVDWPAVTEQLQGGTPVLGPTPERDGTYLIGLTRAQFDRQAFADLPWQTPALFDALRRHLMERAATPALLRTRSDVNGLRDLVALLGDAAALPQDLIATLQSVLGPTGHALHLSALVSTRILGGRRSRAPPASRPAASPAAPLPAIA
jgi:glycosyltransferase A (GT-A) superfamily protein (DUF2064 family)